MANNRKAFLLYSILGKILYGGVISVLLLQWGTAHASAETLNTIKEK